MRARMFKPDLDTTRAFESGLCGRMQACSTYQGVCASEFG